ncbi:DUF2335 domain-containing protein [Streptomyces sp. NBC_01104]|uniref:DUF2335 domain-containing protein n=1 Tax=Streptomyces sp. NBC_01104 TaxID=2903750 RepID=UPI003870DDCB|nr:DUF2335 domain-containing protein [Streptomyces sp. NBC_01104]
MTAPAPASALDPGEVNEAGHGWQDLPLAEQIAQWERVVPGSAERMLRQVEADYEHRRWRERTELRCRVAGMVLGAGAVTGVLWVAKHLIDAGAATAGAGLLGSSVAALVGLVLTRQRQAG